MGFALHLEPEPLYEEYHYRDEHVDMSFMVLVTIHASVVERWIRVVKKRYLDAAATKVVGLDCEFTNRRPGVEQRAAVLQLSVATDTLVFHMCHANRVPQALREFLMDRSINFCGVAIHNDERMLAPYSIKIASAVDLQHAVQPNPNHPNLPALYTLANATISTALEKKKKRERRMEEGEGDLTRGWGNFSLTLYRIQYAAIQYAALDARLGYEIAKTFM